MLTFTRFLAERFLTGFKGTFFYTEVFLNPTKDELRQVGDAIADPPWSINDDSSPCYMIGAIMTERDLYVFNRVASEHAGAANGLPDLPRNWIPLYLYWFPTTNAAFIDLSAFSLKDRLPYPPGKVRLLQIARANRGFAVFGSVRYVR